MICGVKSKRGSLYFSEDRFVKPVHGKAARDDENLINFPEKTLTMHLRLTFY